MRQSYFFYWFSSFIKIWFGRFLHLLKAIPVLIGAILLLAIIWPIVQLLAWFLDRAGYHQMQRYLDGDADLE